MSVFLSLYKLIDISFILFLFNKNVWKKNMFKVTILDSPFHYKLVKTNLTKRVYFIKIKLPYYNKNQLKQLSFNSIKVEKTVKIEKHKIKVNLF